MIEFHGSSFLRKYTSVQSIVENIPPQTAKLPPIIGALSLIAMILPKALRWKPCSNNANHQNILHYIHENMSTYTWGIPESFDALEDCTSDRSHCECTTTVIYNSPRTAKCKTELINTTQSISICFITIRFGNYATKATHVATTNVSYLNIRHV